MIENILSAIDEYLEGRYVEKENYPFHLELEVEMLFNNYEQMHKEDAAVTELLNENIPDICGQVGEISVEEFKGLLRAEFEQVKLLKARQVKKT